MKVELDDRADAAYLYLSPEGTDIAQTVPLADWLNVDLDPDGRIVGVEILHASTRLHLGSVGHTILLAGTREAAEIFGVRPSNFIRDYTGRPDFPAPLAELAGTRVWDRAVLLAYRGSLTKTRGARHVDRGATDRSRGQAIATAQGDTR